MIDWFAIEAPHEFDRDITDPSLWQDATPELLRVVAAVMREHTDAPREDLRRALAEQVKRINDGIAELRREVLKTLVSQRRDIEALREPKPAALIARIEALEARMNRMGAALAGDDC